MNTLDDNDGPRDRTLATERQLQTLVTFYEMKNENGGNSPTIAEVGMRMGMVSDSGPQFALGALVKKGYLVNSKKKARGYQLTAKGLAAAQKAIQERLKDG